MTVLGNPATADPVGTSRRPAASHAERGLATLARPRPRTSATTPVSVVKANRSRGLQPVGSRGLKAAATTGSRFDDPAVHRRPWSRIARNWATFSRSSGAHQTLAEPGAEQSDPPSAVRPTVEAGDEYSPSCRVRLLAMNGSDRPEGRGLSLVVENEKQGRAPDGSSALPCVLARSDASDPVGLEAGGIEPPSRNGPNGGLYMLSPAFCLFPGGDHGQPSPGSSPLFSRRRTTGRVRRPASCLRPM